MDVNVVDSSPTSHQKRICFFEYYISAGLLPQKLLLVGPSDPHVSNALRPDGEKSVSSLLLE
jgi:hypothetical protein